MTEQEQRPPVARPGDHITIVSGEPMTAVAAMTGESVKIGEFYCGLYGHVLLVKAINHPFVLVEDVTRPGSGLISLDLRNIEDWQVCTPDYVRAAQPRSWWGRLFSWS